MTKAALLLGGTLSYLLGLYFSPQIVSVNYLTDRILPLVAPTASSFNADPNAKPVELQSLPPSWSPANTKGHAVQNNQHRREASTVKEIRPEHTYNAVETYNSLLNINESNPDPFLNIKLVIHRNGEADPCSSQKADISISNSFIESSKVFDKPLDKYTKYDFDALITHALGVGSLPKVKDGISPAGALDDSGANCSPTWTEERHYLNFHATTTDSDASSMSDGEKFLISPFVKYCDMGPTRTPIQLDHGKLVRIPQIESLPCHFHTREGLRIGSLEMLADLARKTAAASSEECANPQEGEEGTCSNSDGLKELHLYAVPAGRVFIFAPKYIGEIFELPHVTFKEDLPVSLQVISLSPRVFDIYNFFSRDESSRIVDKAIKETSETHRMKRSSTGASGYNINSQRTSENGFDTHGTEAQAVKRRCLNVLGFDEYEESVTDGLQVLRYNKTTAYIPHLDWIDDYGKLQEHDFDSEHLGSNRFATILLYMSDLEEGDGGETVFTEGWPAEVKEEERVPFDTALSQLRESGDVDGLLKEGSWEESMVARCRSRLSVRPHSSRAVLFYSQEPDGKPDHASLHGGCPVISGEKWAANLWVWNAPRGGFPGAPVNQEVVERNKKANKVDDSQKKATFRNSESDERFRNAKLYFQDTYWGDLGFGDDALHVNTYEGHQWNVKVNEEVLKTIVINGEKIQTYNI